MIRGFGIRIHTICPRGPRVPGSRVVCTEILNSGVVAMESAKDGARIDDTGPLNRARARRILVQRPVSSDPVIVASIRSQNPAQVCLAQDNDVVQTLTPDRSDQPFGNAIQVRTTRWQALWLLGREVRLPLLVAYMAGFGAVVSEVGASQMLGGNLPGSTRVLTCQYQKPKLGRSGDGVHQGWRVN